MAKKIKFDTTFSFGANVRRPKAGGKKAGAGTGTGKGKDRGGRGGGGS